MKAVNEISSDMISRASAKLYGKYGWNGTERDNLESDEHGNPLHPKDKKPMAQHFNNFQDAYKRAKRDEAMQDPIVQKAMELYQDVDWDQEVEDIDGGYATGFVYGSVEDEEGGVWEFEGSAGFNWEGDWVIDDIDDVEFTAPDGTTGSLPL